MTRTQVATEHAGQPRGPYSQGIRMRGDLLFVAGQGPVDPVTQEFIGGSFEDQARLTLRNLLAIVAAGGAKPSDIVKVMVILNDFAHFAAFNKIYEEFFEPPYPARTTFEAPLPGIALEVDAIAVIDAEEHS